MTPEREETRRPVGSGGSGGGGSRGAPGCPRRWPFRVLALLSPLLAVGLFEAGLRLAGIGYPTSFFLEARQDGQAVLVENPKFGWRFFPRAVARSPQPICIAAHKPAGRLRIFVLGESAAMGDPEPSYGLARQLERLLQARHPDREIEVVNAAMTAINSHVTREIARDCAPLGGDLWLIYAGNNEVIGPFGAGTVFGPQVPSLVEARASLAFGATRIGQLAQSMRGSARQPVEWEGMEMFLQSQVRHDDPRLQRVYTNFARNLADTIQIGRRSGTKVLVATMAVNLKDCPPFASTHRAGLAAGELREWEAHFERGRQAEKEGRLSEALAAYKQAGRMDSELAELMFRRGRCELALGQTNEAGADLQRACDLDTLRFRADSRLNEIARQAAAAHGARLIDAEKECNRSSQGNIAGEERFYDHVHLNFAGNYALARQCAAGAESELFGAPPPAAPPWLTEEQVAERLAFTDFDRRRVGEEMRLRLQQPPFASQSNFKERDRWWGDAVEAIRTPPRAGIPTYQAAVALAPKDWMLRANFARLLEAIDDAPAAAAQWLEVARLLPHEPDAWFQLGNLEYNANHRTEAERYLREALKREPGSTEALNGLGLTQAEAGQADQAIRQFQLALKANPRFSAARVNLAVVLAGKGDVSGAMAQYRKVLETDTNNVAARINLGKMLAGQGKPDEAIALYSEAVRLQPENAVLHYDLANALAAQGRRVEAVQHYAAAVQSRPDFVEARGNLGLELARLGKISEALQQFAEVVRLQPTSADGHFNYGVALAKQQRYGEAVREFERTLELRPNDSAARGMLDRATRLLRGEPPAP